MARGWIGILGVLSALIYTRAREGSNNLAVATGGLVSNLHLAIARKLRGYPGYAAYRVGISDLLRA